MKDDYERSRKRPYTDQNMPLVIESRKSSPDQRTRVGEYIAWGIGEPDGIDEHMTHIYENMFPIYRSSVSSNRPAVAEA